tara:strand:- start:172 stop:528 length:357 start_codon:yes stop_codon:yes gene_type:complete
MRLYCPQCGAASDFTAAKPNFCHKCGQSFGLTTAKAQASGKDSQEHPAQEDVPEKEAPDIEGLEVDISSDTHFQHSFGELIGTSEGDGNQLPKRKEKKVSKKKFLEDFKKEAGSIRQK